MLRQMSALKHLHLGHVRLTRERLEDLWSEGKSKLEELTVHGVEITAGSLLALGEYKSLKAMGMTACYQVRCNVMFPQGAPTDRLESISSLASSSCISTCLPEPSSHPCI